MLQRRRIHAPSLVFVLKLIDNVIIVFANVGHMLQLLDMLALPPLFFLSLLPLRLLFLLPSLLSFFFLQLLNLLLAYVCFAGFLPLAADVASIITC